MKTSDGTEWVLVPRVATEEMRDAGYTEAEMLMYRSVIDAAPQPPIEELVRMIAQEIEENAFEPPIAIARAIVKRLIGS